MNIMALTFHNRSATNASYFSSVSQVRQAGINIKINRINLLNLICFRINFATNSLIVTYK